MSKSLKRGFALFLTIMILLSILPANLSVYAQEETNATPGEVTKGPFTLAAWNFEDGENKVYEAIEENKGATITSDTMPAEVKVPTNQPKDTPEGLVLESIGWKTGKSWQTVVSTKGYSQIELSSLQRSSSTGPGYFQIEYSVDGENWKLLVPEYEVRNDWVAGDLQDIKLPAETDNQDKVYIRWAMTKNEPANPNAGDVVSGKGYSDIDNISITAQYAGQVEREEVEPPKPKELVTVSMDFAEGTAYDGLSYKNYEDGPVKEMTVDGKNVVQLEKNSFGGGNHLYLFVDDEYIHGGPYDVEATIKYRSPVAGRFSLQYESAKFGAYHKSEEVSITSEEVDQWQTVKIDIPDAKFTNSQNGGADLRFLAASNLPLLIESITLEIDTEGPEEVVANGDPIVNLDKTFSVGFMLDSNEMQVSKGFGITDYTIEEKPVLKNGVVYVPLYTVIEELGAKIDWDKDKQSVNIRLANNFATHQLGSNEVELNGAVLPLAQTGQHPDASSYGLNNSTIMVPLSFFNHFGATTTYFEGNGRIKIILPAISVSYPSPYPVDPVVPNEISDDEIAFRFAITSDSQGTDQGYYVGTDDGTGKGYELVLDQMKKLDRQPDFIIGAGDLIAGTPGHVVEEQLDQLSNWRKHFEGRFDINTFMPIPGNHEQKGEKVELRKAFQQSFPEFNKRTDVHFLEGYDGSVWYYDTGDARIFGLNNTAAGENHKIIGQQKQWLIDNIDQTKKQTIFVMHEPPFSTWKSGNGMDRFEKERNELWEIVESAPNPIVFVGHEHMYSRKLVNHRFNEVVDGKEFNFDKQIYQVHIAGFGGGLNGITNDFRGVLTDPATMGVYHFAVVDVLKDGRMHIQAISHDGVLLDDFVQSADDVNTTYSSTLTLDQNDVVLELDEMRTLKATLAKNTSEEMKTVHWSSSDESVATVDQNGKVTAVGGGEAHVVASVPGGMFAASKVTVLREGEIVPQQLTMHVGTDASTSVNFAWTTDKQVQTVLKVNKKGETESTTFNGTNALGAGSRYFHKVEVTGLTPDTEYEYTAGVGANTLTGTFETAPEAGNKDGFTFTYITDPQISNAVNSIAAGATFNELSKITDSAFTYIGGDLTDTGSNETQWNLFFHNGGAFPRAGADFLKNNLISVTQGNHDNATFNGHINVPNQSGGAYAFDYGPAKYVILNTENDSPEELKAQEELLRTEAEKAKENGQWIFVGMHKAIYTGASHITDNNIIELRKYWSPIFAELDIDVVLQGHDHVFSRGFVNDQGVNAKPEMLDETTALQPENSPFYMVALTGGGLKWYSAKDYTVSSSDPLTPDYQFLDRNSAKPAGDPLNPEGPQTDKEQETAYVTVSVAPNAVTFNTYLFKYDKDKNEITKSPYLYDTYTIKKKAAEEEPVTPPDQDPNVIKPDLTLSDNAAQAIVSKGELDEAFTKVQKVKGVQIVEIQLEEESKAKAYELTLPTQFLNKSGKNKRVKVSSEYGTITLQGHMLSNAKLSKVENMTLVIIPGKSKDNKPTIELSVWANGKKVDYNHPGAPAEIVIPYEPTEDELKHSERITVQYIDDKGKTSQVKSASYDSDKDGVLFTTTHFGKFAVNYVE